MTGIMTSIGLKACVMDRRILRGSRYYDGRAPYGCADLVAAIGRARARAIGNRHSLDLRRNSSLIFHPSPAAHLRAPIQINISFLPYNLCDPSSPAGACRGAR